MVTSGTALKARIEAKIFSSPPASDATYYNITSSVSGSYNGYEGTEEQVSSASSIKIVPYGYIINDRQFYTFGINSEGTVKVAVKDEVTTNVGDKLLFNSEVYEVIEVNEYPYDNLNLAKILTCKVNEA